MRWSLARPAGGFKRPAVELTLVLAVLVLAPWAATAAAEDLGEAPASSFHLDANGVAIAQGRLDVACRALGWESSLSTPQTFHTAGATLTRISVMTERQVAFHGTAQERDVVPERIVDATQEPIHLPAGSLVLESAQDPAKHLLWVETAGPSTITWTADELDPSRPKEQRPSADVLRADGTLATHMEPGPHRTVANQQAAEVTGDLRMLVRDASIAAADARYESGPTRSQHIEHDPTGQLTTIRSTYRYGWLEATGATGTLPAASQLHCQALRVAVEGTLTMAQAAGRGLFAGTPADVQGTAAFAGAFAWNDEVSLDEAHRPGARSHIEGAVAQYAVNGVASAHVENTAPAKAVAGASLAAAILYVALRFGRWLLIGGAVFYTRVAPEAVLEHPRRSLLFDFIEANPGCTLADASRELEIARAVLEHHLVMLEGAGKVRRIELDGGRRIVPRDIEPDVVTRALMLRHEPLRFIRMQTQGRTVRRADLVAALQASLDLSERSARRWLAKAEQHDFVHRQGRGKGVTYRWAHA